MTPLRSLSADAVGFSKPPALNVASNAPLIVDLDGTLTPTDTLVESIIQVIKQSPITLLLLPIWFLRGRALLKERVADRSSISPALLPYRQEFLSYLKDQKQQGRTIILATAAHESIATAVAKHLALFDTVLATDDQNNLKGVAKLQAIKGKVGDNFVYAGDSTADVPIWQASKAAVLVGVVPGLAASIRKQVPIEKEFPAEGAEFSVWLSALRVHQWLKNLLLFVPLLTAFSFTNLGALCTMVAAFMAFSLAASATYMVNDLWDLESDRAHPRKRLRPFASARISIQHGVTMAGLLLLVALGLALAISKGFFCMLVVRFINTITK